MEILNQYVPTDLVQLILNYLTESNLYVLGIKNKKFEMEEIIQFDPELMVYCLTNKFYTEKSCELFSWCAMYTNNDHLKEINFVNMKWLLENDFPHDENIFMHIAKNSHLEILKWLLEKHFPYNKWTFAYAAKNGNLDNLKWFLENHFPYDEDTFSLAAEKGNLDNLKWLFENKFPYS